jgi:hypothetical protein
VPEDVDHGRSEGVHLLLKAVEVGQSVEHRRRIGRRARWCERVPGDDRPGDQDIGVEPVESRL